MPGRLLLELLARPHLRAVLEILALLARLVRLRDLGLEVHDPPRRARRIGITRVLQDGLDIRFILVARVGHLGIGRQIILRVRQPEAALHQIGQLLARRRQTLADKDAEQVGRREVGRVERIGIGADVGADCRAQLLLVGNLGNRVEVSLGRDNARFVDRVGVEIGVVVIGDQRVVAAGRLGLQDIVEQLAGVLLAHLVGDPEAADP